MTDKNMQRFLSMLVTLCIACVYQLGLAEPSGFPKEVNEFLAERESCDHWRSEQGYDKERQADINWSVCQSCPGTDAKLKALKTKYRSNDKILEKLNELESQIEPKDKTAAKWFCQGTRKPKWLDLDRKT